METGAGRAGRITGVHRTMLTGTTLGTTGLDGLALKPTQVDVLDAGALDAGLFCIDYEGREHVPDRGTLSTLAAGASVYLSVPVRADGFDPLGDDARYAAIPDEVGLAFVAGNAAYLTDEERARAVAPRLSAALADHDRSLAPWIGTEGIERLALAAGAATAAEDGAATGMGAGSAVQYDLLSRSTAGEVRALRRVGFEGGMAVYAPTVLSDDEDAVLDALGDYISRRGPVRRALPEGCATDRGASGRAREVLLDAARDYALVGTASEVSEQVDRLHEVGVDHVVGYPSRGLGELQ